MSVEIGWGWTYQYANPSQTPVQYAATYDGTAKSYTCATIGATFQSDGFAAAPGTAASVKCEVLASSSYSGNPGNLVRLRNTAAGGFTFTAGNTVTITFPAGTITAPSSGPASDTWRIIDVGGGSGVTVTTTVPAEAISALAGETFPPQPPTNVVAVKQYDAALDMDVIRVSWDAPVDQGTLPVSHYSVYGGPEWGAPQYPQKLATCMTDSTAASLTSCVVRSQNAGYSPQLGANVFFVKAFNGLGWSGANSSNLVDVQPDLTPPSAPLNVKAVSGWNSVTVSWDKPLSKGGYPITNYLAYSDPGRKFCITTALSYSGGNVDANALSCKFTDLTPGTKYTFRAQALNGNGWGSSSDVSNVAVPMNLKISSYKRDVTKVLFVRTGSKVILSGGAPGFAAGTKLDLKVKIGAGEWRTEQGAATVTSDAKFSLERKYKKADDGKAISMQVCSAIGCSNTVQIPAVK